MTNEKDKLKRNVENVAEERGNQQAVSYVDLFNPMFMQKNTNFTTIDVFVKELGLKEFQDIESVAQDVIDNFVKKETKFENWQEMQQRAVSDYMTRLF